MSVFRLPACTIYFFYFATYYITSAENLYPF